MKTKKNNSLINICDFDKTEIDSVTFTFWRNVVFFMVKNRMIKLYWILIPFKKCIAYKTIKDGVSKNYNLDILIHALKQANGK
jgi:hypothetical protein